MFYWKSENVGNINFYLLSRWKFIGKVETAVKANFYNFMSNKTRLHLALKYADVASPQKMYCEYYL